jgi:hypothetical protein
VVGDNEQVVSATHNGVEFAGNIGAFFGSKIGQTLGGNALAGKLAAGTVLGAVGKEVGAALTMGASFSLDLAVKDAFGTLAGGPGVGALPSGAIATVSSLLMAELAQKLDLHGVGAGLFNAVGTIITTKLITNAYGVMTGATVTGAGGGQVPVEMFTGFDPVSLATNVGGAVGSFLGSTLAAQIMMPTHPEGATGRISGRRRQAKFPERIVAKMERPRRRRARLWRPSSACLRARFYLRSQRSSTAIACG